MAETQELLIRVKVANDELINRLISAIDSLTISVNCLLDSEHADDAKVVSALDHIVKATEEADVKVEHDKATTDPAAALGRLGAVMQAALLPPCCTPDQRLTLADHLCGLTEEQMADFLSDHNIDLHMDEGVEVEMQVDIKRSDIK